jgi:hypothetical protein
MTQSTVLLDSVILTGVGEGVGGGLGGLVGAGVSATPGIHCS